MLLSKQNIDRKVKQLLASGAKIIDLTKAKKNTLKTPALDKSLENSYLKVMSNPEFKPKMWDTYENTGPIYINSYISSYPMRHYAHERVTIHTLISRPLPGRSKCNLVALFNNRSLNTEIEIRISTSHTLEHRKIGFIGSQGFESKDVIMIRSGEFLRGSKLMSARTMSCSEVIAIEGPNWEDVKSDTFWATFEQDVWELAQVTTVIES